MENTETNKGLIIYNSNGTVINILYGVEEEMGDLHTMVEDIPTNLNYAYVDMNTGEVHFELFPNPQEEIARLNATITELETKLAEYEG